MNGETSLPSITSPTSLAEKFLAANLAALPLGRDTRKAVESATSKGRLVTLTDASPALEIDGQVLGAMPDSATLKSTLSPQTSQASTMFVIFGLGAGHAARELRTRSEVAILIYEPDPGILRTVLEAGPSDLGDTTIVTSIAELQGLWPLLANETPHAVLIATHGYRQLYSGAYDSLIEAIPRFIADVDIVTNTVNARGREWVVNNLENVNELTRTAPALTLGKAFAGLPAFIVGAGPSLAKNGALLAEAAKKGLVIVVDVAGKALAKHGVEPHMLVCLEGLNLSRHMAELPFIDRVTRCFSLSSHPDGFNTGKGPQLPFFEAITQYRPIAELCGCEGVAVGGSVSTVAFSLAVQLGCTTLVLVGQDLAYTGGRTHAEGTPFEHSRVHVDEASGKLHIDACDEAKRVREGSSLGPGSATDDVFMVEAYGGGTKVTSTSSFNAFRMWFEVMGQSLLEASQDIRLVNATEGGSRIAHFEEKALAALLQELPDMPIEPTTIFAAAAKPLRTHAELSAWRNEQARATTAVRDVALRLQRTCTEALEHIDAGESASALRKFDKISTLERQLSDAIEAQPLVRLWATDASKLLVGNDAPSASTESREDARRALRAERDFAAALAASARDLAAEISKHDLPPPQEAATERTQ